ncbi:hypothetical protein C7974DRAFT_387749 [Boeremia exigua]|uniref:uncharacterized protein n=1 Tax=Boeremia exigua TaxID=749465 RepID=UPI001E8E6A34|nr:uncharacterized protein C7974DRAFT_387749 [Boeremia exigua]KAH6639035.1 hypothetical protein C7974DRAFT_387749 [Boeremia exigua]
MAESTSLPPILVFDVVSGEYRDPSDSADTTAKIDAPTKTVLVTGASGLLGRQVQRQFACAGWKAIGTGLTRLNPPDIIPLNLLSPRAIDTVLDETKPEVVVHCAANRFPDSCTANPPAARALNVAATRALAAATAQRGIFLIYISTDYVFPGLPGDAPYSASHPPNPQNIYGTTKLEGERAVLDAAPPPRAVTLRVPILYGPCDEPHHSAINALMSQLWRAQGLGPDEPRIEVDDWARRFPTCTEDVGRVCCDIAARYLSSENRGREMPAILQFSGDECLTKWGVVKVFAEITGLGLEGMVPVRPQDGDAEEATRRPFDCQLDMAGLRELDVDVRSVGFREWWTKELGAFQR